MKNFKVYINESKEQFKKLSKTLSLEDLKEYSKNIQNYYNGNSFPIYRGMNTNKKYFIIDGRDLNRKSADTFNYYVDIIDSSALWKKYPKRSKSFICSTSETFALSYGTVYVVFPLENQKIGVCPENDMWISFGESFKQNGLSSSNSLIKMNDSLAYFFLQMNKIDLIESPSSMNTKEIFKVFDNNIGKGKIDLDLSKSPHFEFSKKLYDLLRTKGTSIIEKSLLNPEINNFKLMYYKDMERGDKRLKNKELWLSEKCLFIRKDVLEQ